MAVGTIDAKLAEMEAFANLAWMHRNTTTASRIFGWRRIHTCRSPACRASHCQEGEEQLCYCGGSGVTVAGHHPASLCCLEAAV